MLFRLVTPGCIFLRHDRTFARQLLGESLTSPYRFFYEIKANLGKEQIAKLYHGGVRWLQPGIESMNTHVLQLMRKGCSMLQNVFTLKCCHSYGITVFWYLLYGFPGETEEDYRKELEVLKAITHLPPPMRVNRIRIDRFSPYFFDRESFPVDFFKPDESYSYVYPAEVDLTKIAYFFDYQLQKTTPDSVHLPKKELVERWNKIWSSSHRDTLYFHQDGPKLKIADNRRTVPNPFLTGSGAAQYLFEEPAGAVYEFCSDAIRSYKQIRQEVESRHGAIEDQLLERILNVFIDLGFMISEDGKYFSLALRKGESDSRS